MGQLADLVPTTANIQPIPDRLHLSWNSEPTKFRTEIHLVDDKLMIKGFLNLPWFLWAALALLVGIIYSFFWPQKAADLAVGYRFFIIRWGHALVWFLLAINFALRGISPSLNSIANLLAFVGGITYVLFILLSLVVK
jgi:hypothetical protein